MKDFSTVCASSEGRRGHDGGVHVRSKETHSSAASINYVADQDGFTMMDMVSYEERHNEANKENNQDGIEYNCTWNCGAEGPTRKQSIRKLRLQQLKNAFALLLSAQGTPLDLFREMNGANTQKGNNNAYCQDNPTGGWTGAAWSARRSCSLCEDLIALRKAHPVLAQEKELLGMDQISCGVPDVSYHAPVRGRPPRKCPAVSWVSITVGRWRRIRTALSPTTCTGWSTALLSRSAQGKEVVSAADKRGHPSGDSASGQPEGSCA